MKIILIEDSITTGLIIRSLLQNHGFEVIWYKTFESALTGLNDVETSPGEFPDIAAIIFDYNLDHEEPSTSLVAMIAHRGFSGVMIANSSDEDHNMILKGAGCTHVRPGTNKTDVVEVCCELLLN